MQTPAMPSPHTQMPHAPPAVYEAVGTTGQMEEAQGESGEEMDYI